jgi:hypothetical protein
MNYRVLYPRRQNPSQAIHNSKSNAEDHDINRQNYSNLQEKLMLNIPPGSTA